MSRRPHADQSQHHRRQHSRSRSPAGRHADHRGVSSQAGPQPAAADAAAAAAVPGRFAPWVLSLSDSLLPVSRLDYRLLQTAPESQYSSLLPHHISGVRGILASWFSASPPSHIVDATAHIGVDTLNFAVMFPHARISAYEPDDVAVDCLRRNVDSCHGGDVITVHHMSCLDRFYADKQPHSPSSMGALVVEEATFIYIDAPWGGPSYKSERSLHLFLSDARRGRLDVIEVARHILTSGQAKTVVLKVPFNFCFDELRDTLALPVTRHNICYQDRISFVLLRIDAS